MKARPPEFSAKSLLTRRKGDSPPMHRPGYTGLFDLNVLPFEAWTWIGMPRPEIVYGCREKTA